MATVKKGKGQIAAIAKQLIAGADKHLTTGAFGFNETGGTSGGGAWLAVAQETLFVPVGPTLTAYASASSDGGSSSSGWTRDGLSRHLTEAEHARFQGGPRAS